MPQSNIKEKTSSRVKEPSKYYVVLYNDDFTTMDFVTDTLINIFHMMTEEAFAVMLDIHHSGKGKVGPYSYDIATTRCRRLLNAAKREGFPLRAEVEKA